MDENRPSSRRWVKVLIVALPVWLAVSGAIGLVLFLRSEHVASQTPDFQMTRDINGESLMDDVRKLSKVVGERNFRSEETRSHLRVAAKMIEGSLSPQNTGFRVNRSPTEVAYDQQWSIYWVEVEGKKAPEEVVWLFAGYDSPLSSTGTELNATGVAALLALGQSLANATPDRTVRLAFLPHAYEENFPLSETARMFNKVIVESGGQAIHVLHVNRMGLGGGVMTTVETPAAAGQQKPYRAITSTEPFASPAGELGSLLMGWKLPVAEVFTVPVVGSDRIDDLPDPLAFERAVMGLRALVLDLATR